MHFDRRTLLLLGAALAFGFGVALAVAIDDAPGRSAGPTNGGRPVLVELGSTSCASCRAMQPVLAELRASHGERLEVRSIDVFKQRDAIAEWDVRVIPTQVFLDGNGREFERHIGFLSAAGVRAVLARRRIHLDGAERSPS
jgi:thiol-disulfide isomerase/thioredoxin